MTDSRVLAVRLDSLGDMLLMGPAVRAIAASGSEVAMLAGPAGASAARILPGVSQVLTWNSPWISAHPPPVDSGGIAEIIEQIRAFDVAQAIIFTSFHQSALPTALVLRLAQIPVICAFSEDYPGSLLDLRVAPPGDIPETERALMLANAAGFHLPPEDDGRLAVTSRRADIGPLAPDRPYVAVHPGASAPARAWSVDRWKATIGLLIDEGYRPVITGSSAERAACEQISAGRARTVAGQTDLVGLVTIIAGAEAIVVSNTGPAHIAAAVGTPVVSLFAPTVPAERWAPYRVPTVLLGDQQAPCRGTRAVRCPVPGHPCLEDVKPRDVLDALQQLRGGRPARHGTTSEVPR